MSGRTKWSNEIEITSTIVLLLVLYWLQIIDILLQIRVQSWEYLSQKRDLIDYWAMELSDRC